MEFEDKAMDTEKDKVEGLDKVVATDKDWDKVRDKAAAEDIAGIESEE